MSLYTMLKPLRMPQETDVRCFWLMATVVSKGWSVEGEEGLGVDRGRCLFWARSGGWIVDKSNSRIVNRRPTSK